MADPFTPKFVDLVKNYTTSTGTGDFTLGAAVNGFTSFASACQVGDRFYYSCIGIDKPVEREVGRGTLLAGGKIAREPIGGGRTSFTTGNKAIALIAAAEWFGGISSSISSAVDAAQTASSAAQAASSAAAQASTAATSATGAVSAIQSEVDAIDANVALLGQQVGGAIDTAGAASTAAQAASEAAADATIAAGAASAAIATVQSQVDTVEADVGTLAVQVASLDSEIDGTSQDLADLSAQVAAMEGGGGSSGSASFVATRAELAAANPASGSTRMLGETGREGLFAWDPSDHSALVTADVEQGISIAPSGGNGSTGAWVRKFDGAINARWFGMAPAASAADNSAAINGTLAVSKALGFLGNGYATGGPAIHIPSGEYALAEDIVPDFAVCIFGDYTGMFSGGGTVLQFPASSHGISPTKDVGNLVLHGLRLEGNSAIPGSGYHGLNCFGKVTAWNLYIGGFEHGIHPEGFFELLGTNCNGSSFRDIACQGNVWGTWTEGPDANNITFYNVSCIANLLGGHRDSSTLGSNYIFGDCSSNGYAVQSTYLTRAHVGGHIYMVRDGQEAWCSTNAPSGTTAHNQGWLYLEEGSAAGHQPTWTTGQTWYFSSPWCMDTSNSGDNTTRSLFDSVYTEFNQNPCIMEYPGTTRTTQQYVPVLNGDNGAAFAAHLYSGADGYEVGGAFKIEGTATINSGMAVFGGLTGVQTLTVANDTTGNIRVGNTTQATAVIEMASAGTGLDGAIKFSYGGSDRIVLDADHNGNRLYWYAYTNLKYQWWTNNGTQIGEFDTTGLNVKVGSLKINGTDVIDSSRNIAAVAVAATGNVTTTAGKIGYATGAGGTVTQTNNKSTGVTLHKPCGEIALAGGSLAANTAVTFTLTNSFIEAGDRIVVNHKSGGTFGAYVCDGRAAAGSATLMLRNVTAAALSEAVVLGFAVVKAVTA